MLKRKAKRLTWLETLEKLQVSTRVTLDIVTAELEKERNKRTG